MKNFRRLLLLTVSFAALNAAATVLTFERELAAGATTTSGAWPVGYGDRVVGLSYIPANYAPAGPRSNWYYGGGGGFTPHIVADFMNTGNNDSEGSASASPRQTTPTTGDLAQTFTGSLATFGNDYLEVVLTADPGYFVQLSTFDIANNVGDHPLHSLQIIADGATILSQVNVPIRGGVPPEAYHTHFDGAWLGRKITLRLEATFFSGQAAGLHISDFGIDNIQFSEVPALALTCPPSLLLQCPDEVPAVATDVASFLAQGGTITSGLGCSSPVLTVDEVVEGTACYKTILRFYHVTTSNPEAACFETAHCTQTIIVQDTTSPVATTPAFTLDRVLECSDAFGLTLALSLAPNFTDNCGVPSVTLTRTDNLPDLTCPNAQAIVRHWEAVDDCGHHSSEFIQTITIRDTTAPVATTAAGSLDRTVQCGDAINGAAALALSPTFTDNCAGAVSLSVPSIETLPDLACPNSYVIVRRWHAVDACGQVSLDFVQRITFVDASPPVATTPTGSLDRTVEAGDGVAFAAALALSPAFNDACQGTVPPGSPTTGFVADAGCTGTAYERRWHATDACGHTSADFVQRITLTDTHGPTLACPPNQMVITGPGPVFFAATASDNSDLFPPATSVTITFSPPSGSTFPRGTTPVTCRATDRCGNSTECTFNVTVDTSGCSLRVDHSAILEWDCGVLQYASSPTGPFTELTGASSPSIVSFSDERRFYAAVGCERPNIRIIPSLTAQWSCGILQSASSIGGPYADVPGAVSPYTTRRAGGIFFRIR